jgi:peptidoglycan/LPS O-acetylase OafA/YrhL
VLLGHSLIFFESPEWFRRATWITDAHAAVVIFFVLSGFVLSNALRNTGSNVSKIAAFYVRRLFRIYPALWACSVIALVYVAMVHYDVAVPHESAWFEKRFLPERNNPLSVAASFAGVYPFLLPQLWSIYVELVASVAMPFLALAVFSRRGAVKIGAGLALLALSFASPRDWPPAIAGTYLVDFYIGALLFAGSATIRRLIERLGSAQRPILIACVALLASAEFATVGLDYNDPAVNLAEALIAGVAIAIFAFSPQRPKWAARPRWVALGDISYSIYLVHFPVLCFVATAIGVAGFAFNGVLWNLGVSVGTIAITIPLSALLYQHVEKPGIAWGKRALSGLSLSRGKDAEIPAL